MARIYVFIKKHSNVEMFYNNVPWQGFHMARFHTLLLATGKKKNILIAWCCICGATMTFLLSLRNARRVCWFFYQKIQRLVTCDCLSKSLQAHLSPTHSLPQYFLILHKHHVILLSVSGKPEENGEKTWTTPLYTWCFPHQHSMGSRQNCNGKSLHIKIYDFLKII